MSAMAPTDIKDDADAIAGSLSGLSGTEGPEPVGSVPIARNWRFWMVFASLSITGLLSAIEATVISTALPTISERLTIGEDYAWLVNSYFLTSMIFQPLFGQVADIFGRRWLMISSVAVFVFGSGICGGASSSAMLIAGRTIQGIGGGGVNVLIELIICDLVPLRERGKFLGIVLSTFTVGASVGPFLGGIIVENTTWRWIFYMNLPIGGGSLLLLFAFLQVQYTKESTFLQKMKRIDWPGNAVLIPALIAILIALTDAGTKAPWSSWRIIVPLTVGLAGLIAFQFYESSKFCLEPTVPPSLFSNRTTVTAYILVFLQTITAIWVIYFFPVYFQAVLLSSPYRSGVQILATFLVVLPFAAFGGVLVSKFGRYRPIHHVGFALMTLGFGLNTLLDSKSSTAEWVIYQSIIAAGQGLLVSSALPAIQAGLPEELAASSTATFAFTRSFGAVWGVTIPAVIFNNQFNKSAKAISDPAVRALFSNGQAYAHGTRDFINSFEPAVREEIIGVYVGSLKVVWQVAIAISAFSFLLVFIEKEIKLRTELETEYGMKGKRAEESSKSLEKV
ncbi:major facilitator superfamily domain-containing protein [Cadophora sp. MPI-SDFR-AT-0126]|nr:major facilitator superfamily domain-containing protein [Leotiomycetes sp. MPI-SDFR-AT-0126]